MFEYEYAPTLRSNCSNQESVPLSQNQAGSFTGPRWEHIRIQMSLNNSDIKYS